MLIFLTFGECGHFGSYDAMGKNVEETIDEIRRSLEKSGECNACWEIRREASRAERIRLVEEANQGLPPMEQGNHPWDRFRAMEIRGERRKFLDRINEAYAKRLKQPGVTLRIRCEAKEALERTHRILSRTKITTWLGHRGLTATPYQQPTDDKT